MGRLKIRFPRVFGGGKEGRTAVLEAIFAKRGERSSLSNVSRICAVTIAFFLLTEMLRLQGFEREHLREDRAAGHAGDQVGDRPVAALRMEQILDRGREGLVDGRPFSGVPGEREQPHREPP